MDDFVEIIIFLLVSAVAVILLVFYVRLSSSVRDTEDVEALRIVEYRVKKTQRDNILEVRTEEGRVFEGSLQGVKTNFDSWADYIVVWNKMGITDAEIYVCYATYMELQRDGYTVGIQEGSNEQVGE